MKLPLDDASRFGVAQLDQEGMIKAFAEKPADPVPVPEDPAHVLASMGMRNASPCPPAGWW